MYEAAVELQVAIDVPKRIVPMVVVEVGIASEHLLDDALDIRVVVWRETRRFAHPLILVVDT